MKYLNNSVTLIGRLKENPLIRTNQYDKKCARIKLGTDATIINKKGEVKKIILWHNLIAWDGNAELIEKYLVKGNKIAIQGNLSHSSLINNNKEEKNITFVEINEIMFLG